MLNDIRLLIAELKKNPLPTICGLLVFTVVFLWLQLVEEKRNGEKKEQVLLATIAALQEKVLETEKSWALRYDGLRLDFISELKQTIERQNRIEQQQKRILKIRQ